MAEELFHVRRLVTVAPGKAYPTGDEWDAALCTPCWRLYFDAGFPISSLGLIPDAWVEAHGLDALKGSMFRVQMASANPANTTQRWWVPCDLCGRPADDPGDGRSWFPGEREQIRARSSA